MSELTTTNTNNAVATTSTPSAPARSLNQQVVLDEDEYTEALSRIIARDFFPSLVHLDAANSYLDALRTEDPTLIHASVRQLEMLQTPSTAARRRGPLVTPSQTPWAAGPSDTPLHTFVGVDPDAEGGPPQKRARLLEDAASLGLDAFQARYTSEDNASFTQILDDENHARAERYGWAWDAQRRVEAAQVKMVEARERLMIEPLQQAPGVRERRVIEPPDEPRGLLTDGKEAEEGEKEEEDGVDRSKELAVVEKAGEEESAEVDVMAPKKDTRSAAVDGWKFKTRNAFMFPPDADVAPYNTATSSTLPSRGEPKSIEYTNTRLPEQNEGPAGASSSISEPPSPTRSRIDAAIAGTPYRPRSPTNNGFSLLPTLPSPTPEQLGPAAVKQLMTWGTLNATPRILSTSADDDPADSTITGTPFHLPVPSARETLGHRLSNSAAKSLRARAALMGSGAGLGLRGRDGTMPPPEWTPTSTPRKADAAGALTPAARRLLDRSTAGTAGARRADAMGRAAGWTRTGTGAADKRAKEQDLNRVRWTPSPAPVSRRR